MQIIFPELLGDLAASNERIATSDEVFFGSRCGEHRLTRLIHPFGSKTVFSPNIVSLRLANSAASASKSASSASEPVVAYDGSGGMHPCPWEMLHLGCIQNISLPDYLADLVLLTPTSGDTNQNHGVSVIVLQQARRPQRSLRAAALCNVPYDDF